ncbi:radical SAM protein [uncultured Campylobacter sp.]|uniref:radical SAM protein n=1 Tax=uncultured Campylobacter sp. TaxID=218934 RepID=UPI002611B440|nr:radical SAM protein [uncultured Campylobacter sp.]
MFKERIKSHHRSKLFESVSASENELFDALEQPAKDSDCVIYLHVPFCDNICSFCSMMRSKLGDELDEYAKFLIRQIKDYGEMPYFDTKSVKSIYFGGGTPSVFSEAHFEKVLGALHKNFKIADDCEISIETTLHNLDTQKALALQSFGVNRFSIGVQTFSRQGRALLNRVHKPSRAIKRLKDLREKFDGMLCCDIIYNFPGESVEEALEDARYVDELGLDSASFYSLMFFDGSELSKKIDTSYYDLPTDKKLHHTFAEALLGSGNFEVLELTKLARKGRDNYGYIKLSHKGTDILPIGNGAGGHIAGFGIYGVSGHKMISRTNERESAYGVLCSLFQYPIVNLNALKDGLSASVYDEALQKLKEFESWGLLELKDGKSVLNLDGVFWGNNINEEIANIIRKDFV